MSAPLSTRRRLAIWTQAVLAAGAVLAATLAFDAWLLPDLAEWRALRLGVAFAMIQLLTVAAISAELLVSKWLKGWARRREMREAPLIREMLTAHALGQDRSTEIGTRAQRVPRIFERTLFELVALLDGEPRERLADVAEQHGVVERWLRRLRSGRTARRLHAVRALGFVPGLKTRRGLLRALDDDSEDVQLAAAHSLVRLGHPHDLEHVLEFATGQSLWSRAVLGHAMQPYAVALRARAIPTALQSADPARLEAVLEFLKQWKVRVPAEWLRPLQVHPDARIRSLAVALLPQVEGLVELESSLRRGFSDASELVRTASASVAGRMKVLSLAPLLEACVRCAPPSTQLAAATALARCGPDGLEILERLAKGDDQVQARVAAEVVEKARIGRLQFATSEMS